MAAARSGEAHGSMHAGDFQRVLIETGVQYELHVFLYRGAGCLKKRLRASFVFLLPLMQQVHVYVALLV